MEKLLWHMLSTKEIFRLLNTSVNGLSAAEAKRRLQDYGFNELKKEEKVKWYTIFLNQFKSFLIIVLIIAAIISLVLGEFIDGLMILLVVFLNSLMGFFQEYKASKAIEALRKMTEPVAFVIRDGIKQEIPSKFIVPGDIIILEEGKNVPADSRLIECVDLYADESTLTGESLPVSKNFNVTKQEIPIAEMRNMVFMGTNITRGNGIAVVTATGKDTEIGKIAKLVQEEDKMQSPLQMKLENMGRKITIFILITAFLIFFAGTIEGRSKILELFLVSVALSVSAIPEALPAVITLTLALGMQLMARNKAIVKKLLAVETLGITSVICSDKTGTLTKNEMTVSKMYTDNKVINVTGIGYTPEGEFLCNNKKIDISKNKNLQLLFTIASYCNNSSLIKSDGEWKIIGDPTEGALTVLARKAGIEKSKEGFCYEIPFSSERKIMSVIYFHKNKFYSYVKGAPEKIINQCSKILLNGQEKNLSKAKANELIEIAKEMAGEPLRVLALAYKIVKKSKKYSPKETEEELVFVGLTGMIDPPRLEVTEAIKTAHEAGIKTVMITGDHKVTAIAIAKQIGIMNKDEIAVTGVEIDAMTDKELEEIVDNISVFARVSTEHKVRILEALRNKGHVVAMTGDGVNDAPALKKSDIGIAMGIKGTDVAKEASDMILQDDNYSTIIKAVKSGREIYDNIKKAVKYMLSMNIMEVFLVGITVLLGYPLPLLPLHILWINMATEPLPALSLSVDTPDADVMKRNPRKRNESIFARGMLPFMVAGAFIGTACELFIFFFTFANGLAHARTMVLTMSVMFQLIFVFNCRSETKSVFMLNPFSNIKLVFAVLTSVSIHLCIVYLPFMQKIFQTTPLLLSDWLLILCLASLALAVSPLFFFRKEKLTT